jgi:hypothetical protein
MNPETPEHFVDADETAKFLSLTRRLVLDLVRAGDRASQPSVGLQRLRRKK